jgi:alkylmercury lyase
LTLVPTAHSFKIGDRDLYAWCAQDTIFLPGLLGVTAEVTSPDPQSRELIKVAMTPDGPTAYSPESAVVTFLEAAEAAVGPESAVCTNSHYFTSEASAAEWSRNRPGIAILSVEDAFARMKKNLLDVLQPILDQME